MKNTFILIASTLVLMSCNNEEPTTHIEPQQVPAPTVSEPVEQPKLISEVPFTFEDVSEKMFTSGSLSSLNDSCTLNQECECCSGTFYFNSDSTFYYTSSCQADESWTIGNYYIDADLLVLEYSGAWAVNQHTWDTEAESTTDEFVKRDTIIDISATKYAAKNCNNQIIFETDLDVLISSPKNYSEELNNENHIEFIDRLKKLSSN